MTKNTKINTIQYTTVHTHTHINTLCLKDIVIIICSVLCCSVHQCSFWMSLNKFKKGMDKLYFCIGRVRELANENTWVTDRTCMYLAHHRHCHFFSHFSLIFLYNNMSKKY